MASNFTENYGLCQWEATDQVLRTDFNEDNAKIDVALKGLSEQNTALEASVAAAVAAAGNCEMELITYTGTGTKGSATPTKISFSQMPDVFFVVGDMAYIMGRGGIAGGVFTCKDASTSDSFVTDISGTWSGNTVSYQNSIDARYQMNSKNKAYWVLGLTRKG